MKARLVESHRERIARIERGELKVVGQNCFTETEDSPLTAGEDGGILTPDPEVERERIEALEQWKAERDQAAVDAALDELAEAAARRVREHHAGDDRGRQGRRDHRRVGRACCARSSATTAARPGSRRRRRRRRTPSCSPRSASRSTRSPSAIGHRIRILVGKPGLDGHSNGAEQIAVRARDVGMEVDLPGHPPDARADRRLGARRRTSTWSASRSSPARTASSSPRSSSCCARQGVDVPVVVGGIIPPADAARSAEAGVAGVYTPKDFDLNRIMGEIADLVAERHRAPSRLREDGSMGRLAPEAAGRFNRKR